MLDIYILDPRTVPHPPWLIDCEYDLTFSYDFWLESEFKKMGLNVIRADLNKIKTLDCPWFYIQNFFPWLYSSFFTPLDGILEEYSDELMQCLTKNGYLVFDNIGESETTQFYEFFYSYIRSTPMPADRVIYDVSSLSAERVHTEYCDSHLIAKRMIIVQSYFWERMGHYYTNKTILDKSSFLPTDFKNREKVFLNYNRRLRFHRPVFVSLLAYYNLLKFGFVSLFEHDQERITTIYKLSELYQNKKLAKKIDEGYSKIEDDIPLIVDYTDPSINYADDPTSLPFYQKTYFSLVSCTFFENRENTIQMNEKIFKPIAYKQPFILTGLTGTLAHLRDYGFKTFAPFIDETYDTIEDEAERAEAILHEVDRLCKLSTQEWDGIIEQLEPILLYNFERLKNEGVSVEVSNIMTLVRIVNDG